MDSHSLWAYAHILLFAYWLGADLGVWLVMAFVRDGRLSFDTRSTLIRLAFAIDLAPRVAFALILPVGLILARDLGLLPVSPALLAAGWLLGGAWAALHVTVFRRKGTPLARRLLAVNQWYEALMGALFTGIGLASLATGAPVDQDWFATKLLLFGLIFWVILGIDVKFQPFTTILRLGPGGSSPEKEAVIRRMTSQTMAWALLLYALIAAVAFLGRVKPW